MQIAASFHAFFEDRRALPGEPAAWLFEGLIDCLVVHDSPSLEQALLAIERDGWWTVAAFNYELGYLLEPAAAPPGWLAAEGGCLATFWRFERCLVLDPDGAADWLAAQVGVGEAAGIGGLELAISEKNYIAAVDRIRDYIFSGDCYQVNFTFPLNFEWFGTPLGLYSRLRQQQPVRYGGFVGATAGGTGPLSPEWFLGRHGGRLGGLRYCAAHCPNTRRTPRQGRSAVMGRRAELRLCCGGGADLWDVPGHQGRTVGPHRRPAPRIALASGRLLPTGHLKGKLEADPLEHLSRRPLREDVQ